MQSVPRKLVLGLILAAGIAAYGDVTVAEELQPVPAVRSVVVSPSAATIAPAGTFLFDIQLVASVEPVLSPSLSHPFRNAWVRAGPLATVKKFAVETFVASEVATQVLHKKKDTKNAGQMVALTTARYERPDAIELPRPPSNSG